MITEGQQHKEYTQILFTFSSGKEGNRRRKDGRASLTQDCSWCTAAVWLPRQRRIATKNSLVTGSQKSWGWDKPDVCTSLRTALRILNYKDLRDFTENCRHPDMKITFVFLSESGLGFPTFPGIKTFANSERETQKNCSVSNTAEGEPRQQLTQEQKSWYPLDMERCTCHGDFSLKRSSLFSLRFRNEICSACLICRQGKVNC